MSIEARRLAGWLLDEAEGEGMDPRPSALDWADQPHPGGFTGARDFIWDNPRPELEAAFETGLEAAGYEGVYCRALHEPMGMEVWLTRSGDPDEFFGSLIHALRSLASQLHLRILGGTIRGRGRGNRLRTRFRLEPAN